MNDVNRLTVGLSNSLSLPVDKISRRISSTDDHKVVRINLKRLKITEIDMSHFTLLKYPETISKIDLSDNNITKIYNNNLEKLTNLHALDFSINEIEEISREFIISLKHLTKLTHLDFQGNKLSKIPREIINVKSLLTLDLRDNDFRVKNQMDVAGIGKIYHFTPKQGITIESKLEERILS